MALTKTTKQSYESYFVFGNFAAVFEVGETITDHTVLAFDSTGADATDVVISAGSELVGEGDDVGKLFVRIKDGEEANSPYKLTFRIVTSTGNKWEVDGNIVVKEK